MSYTIKEMYYTLQGEGIQYGRPAILVRFSGCNLWSGREEDRGNAICKFCDTDFVGTDGPAGGTFAYPQDLVAQAKRLWPNDTIAPPFIVCTGGEPLLQLDQDLVDVLHQSGFEIAVETNGTLMPPDKIDWICVSPKAGADLRLKQGDELKLVFPQDNAAPEDYLHLRFRHFVLQPMAGPQLEENIRKALDYCLQHPEWRLGLQIHKILNIP